MKEDNFDPNAWHCRIYGMTLGILIAVHCPFKIMKKILQVLTFHCCCCLRNRFIDFLSFPQRNGNQKYFSLKIA